MATNTEAGSSQQSENVWWIKIENEQTECQDSDFKTKYYKQLMDFYDSKQMTLKKPWTIQRILEVIDLVKTSKTMAESRQRRTSMQYYWTSKYDVSSTEGAEYLIMKKNKPEDPAIRVIPLEQYFDLLWQIHNELDHGGRDKMIYVIKNKFYVQKKAVEIFISLCPKCETKRNERTKKSTTTNFNSTGQVDLIDFQSIPDEDYKWVLKYQDKATKFIHLCPLRTNQVTEIALQLVKIFLTFGPPSVFQSNDEQIIKEVNKIWPDCNIKSEVPLPLNEDEDNLQVNNNDIEDMLHTWIQENGSTNWSLGCHFIQYRLNTSIQLCEVKSSYRALFGCDPKSSISVDHPKISKSNECTSSNFENINVGIKEENEKKGIKRKADEDEVTVTNISLNIGDTVHINVPEKDRGPLNTRLIVGKILDFENGVYQVGTKSGIIVNWFSINDLQIINTEFKEEVPQNSLTLKEAVIKESLLGFTKLEKCNCKSSKHQCRSLRCACFKKKVLCGPKCHNNIECLNIVRKD
ncbi:KRAB-A domain-containing protein 2-like [Plodia interpunctella]|uniref:KRAB-A domain-containing protein 2-like n=1 Tax=Plodia interpunctella TaxID=58824 RepID=UPI002368973A|nr:KRAB-A domain-containing protein 2-like [Plodia interpunctella]